MRQKVSGLYKIQKKVIHEKINASQSSPPSSKEKISKPRLVLPCDQILRHFRGKTSNPDPDPDS